MASPSTPILRRLRSRLLPDRWLLPTGHALPPVDVTFELTYGCNLACPHCYQRSLESWRPPAGDEGEVPTVDELVRFLEPIRRWRPGVRLTGGEPLLDGRLFELAGRIKAMGLPLVLPTNGVLLAEQAERLLKVPFDTVIVSLLGPEEVQDRTTGRAGTYRAISEGIRRLLALRSGSAGAGMQVLVNVVLTPENHGRLVETVHLADELGVDGISVTHLWFWNRATAAEQQARFPDFGRLLPTGAGALTGIDPAVVLGELREIRRRSWQVPVRLHPELTPEQVERYYREPDQPVIPQGCRAPWLVTYVRPNGDVAPCYLDHPVGNLRRQTFREIWNGAPYRRFRRALARHGQLPACRRCPGLFLFSGGGGGQVALGSKERLA